MLGDFPLSIDVEGERYDLIARDVPTAVFFQRFPNSFQGTDCWAAEDAGGRWQLDLAMERWMLELLTRVIVMPRLTLELVRRLGDAAFEPVVGYLHAVGWITDADLERQMAEGRSMGEAAARYLRGFGARGGEVLPISLEVEPVPYDALHRPFIGQVAPNVKRAVIEVARLTGQRPSAIWQAPISEYIFDWRALLADELLQTSAPPEGAHVD